MRERSEVASHIASGRKGKQETEKKRQAPFHPLLIHLNISFIHTHTDTLPVTATVTKGEERGYINFQSISKLNGKEREREIEGRAN